MAKKTASGGVNKSQAIRDYLSEKPGATASEIVPALEEKGISVTPGLVSQVKSTIGGSKPTRKTTKKKKGGAKKTSAPKATRSTSKSSLSATELMNAKKFADELGGIERTRQALDMLEQLK
ncbi:hypothetical protein [Thalassoroseus pseudoceratinae]|uniref:hypothetical protein n=1 Tax=Thalassoroseus pseudoceratinae TaxID=2713176 RepID=UPI00141EA96D|nr:hypothetical protein [Thalassoroseus pseudoceratinae]